MYVSTLSYDARPDGYQRAANHNHPHLDQTTPRVVPQYKKNPKDSKEKQIGGLADGSGTEDVDMSVKTTL